MNSLRVLSLLLAPAALFAQKPSEPVTHTYEMKTMDLGRSMAIRDLVNSLSNGRVMINWLPALHTLVLKGSEPDVQMVETLLAKYDVPPRQVEFTAYVVRAAKSNEPFRVYFNTLAKSGLAGEPAQPAPLPAVLNSPIEEMKHTFGYASFELLDTSITRTSSHAHSESGLAYPNAGYEIDYNDVSISSDGKVVTIPHFSFRMLSHTGRIATTAASGGRGATANHSGDEFGSYLENEVVIHGDERLIVGKLRMPNGQAGDVFVILTAKPL